MKVLLLLPLLAGCATMTDQPPSAPEPPPAPVRILAVFAHPDDETVAGPALANAARRGAHVIAVARTVGGLEDLDDEIQALGGSTTLVPLDLRDSDGIDRLGAAIFSRWGRLDGLVANAGTLKVLSPLITTDCTSQTRWSA